MLTLGLSTLGCTGSFEEVPPGEFFDSGKLIVSRTSTLKHTFQVTNSTSRPVRIQGETHSCGCTDIELRQVVLDPGESTPLTMTVRLPTGLVEREVGCTVKTDHPRFPEWNYTLRYATFPVARIATERIDLGTISLGEAQDDDQPGRVDSAEQTWLELYTSGDEAAPEFGTIVGPDELIADLDPNPIRKSLGGGVERIRHRLSVSLRPGMSSAGTYARSLSLPIAGGPSVSTTVVWSAKAPVVSTPAQVHSGMLTPGADAVTRKLLIRSSDGRQFRLLPDDPGPSEGLVPAIHGIAADAPPSTSHIATLALTIPETESGRAFEGAVRFRTDIADFPEVRIPWSVFLRRSERAEEISTDPDSQRRLR